MHAVSAPACCISNSNRIGSLLSHLSAAFGSNSSLAPLQPSTSVTVCFAADTEEMFFIACKCSNFKMMGPIPTCACESWQSDLYDSMWAAGAVKMTLAT